MKCMPCSCGTPPRPLRAACTSSPQTIAMVHQKMGPFLRSKDPEKPEKSTTQSQSPPTNVSAFFLWLVKERNDLISGSFLPDVRQNLRRRLGPHVLVPLDLPGEFPAGCSCEKIATKRRRDPKLPNKSYHDSPRKCLIAKKIDNKKSILGCQHVRGKKNII